MKILYLIQAFPTLSEIFTLNEIIGLIDLGHDVIVLSENDQASKIVHESVIKHNIRDKVIYMPNYPCGKKKVIDFIKKVLYDIIKNPVITLKTIFFISKTCRNIWIGLDNYMSCRLIWGRNIDLINLTFSYPEGVDKAFILSKLLKSPFVLTFRAYDLYKIPYPEILKQKSKIIKEASKLIVISKYNRNTIRRLLNIKEEIPIIHDSVDVDFLSRKQRYRKNKIICVCRFIQQKGIVYLIEVCSILQQRKIKYSCTLVGAGPEEKNYRNMIKKYNIHSIRFTGPLTQKQVKKELDSSAIFVFPCIVAEDGDRDILANVLKEAMAMEVPVVTSNISGIEELVEEGVNGILVPPKNPEAVANAVERFFKNSGFREKMGKAGRKKIEKDFNTKIEIEKLEKVFYDIVKNKI